ncbi:unnamed protein product [Spirodela intermedia]|uniref:Uncharacterized protein n=1 Tax=Spirodela intermedia TaxID=51605 RepID=A0A7I8IYQ6_SPIIN|nr:unnamed protein product [Spirodela intermedia]CAA6663104.1 unnamed protein product [Spirodela intermedia]
MELIGNKQRRREEAGESGRESSAEALLSGETRLYQKHFPGTGIWRKARGASSAGTTWSSPRGPEAKQERSVPHRRSLPSAEAPRNPRSGEQRALLRASRPRPRLQGELPGPVGERLHPPVRREGHGEIGDHRLPGAHPQDGLLQVPPPPPQRRAHGRSGGGGGAASSFAGRDQANGVGTVIDEHLLEFLLRMDHSEEADNPVPATVSNLVVHIIDTYVDHVHDIITNLEMELDAVELELDKGGFTAKKQMMDDRRFPKMHLNLQRLLLPAQVVAHGEQVFPRVKEKLANKSWFASEDTLSLEELIGRLRRLKENVGFIVNRVTAIQAGLDSWQAEQINRKLYYLSFLSMIFLPLSIVTGIFGMNVGGVPWTAQRAPSLDNGFRNVLLICAGILLFLLVCFTFPALYARISAWKRRRALKRNLSLNRKSFLKRGANGSPSEGRGYVRI